MPLFYALYYCLDMNLYLLKLEAWGSFTSHSVHSHEALD